MNMNDKQKYFGLDQLDRRIAEHVKATTGVFVELGAFDGVRQSNTVFFERLGWRGVLIEANPESARACQENRPLAKVFQCACVSASDPRKELTLTTCGLMTIVKGAKGGSDQEEAWISRGEQVQSIDRAEVTVPARTLQSVLDEAGVTKVDMLVIDVEGYEIPVLDGLDFTRLPPKWIVGEDDYNDDLRNYLGDKGYREEAVLLERKFTRDILYKLAG